MRPYRLAVCEDDTDIREQVSRLCDEILTDVRIAHEITSFANAEELDKNMGTEQEFDVLVLDIKLEHMTGMELARKLRKEDNQVSIIFITGYEEYLREGYGVRPVHLLLKPVDRERLKEALLTDWRLNHKPRGVMLQKGNRSMGLMLEEILYAESSGNHSIRVVLKRREETFPFTLSELGRLLPEEGFARCHSGYLVNLGHVRELDRFTIRLDNGGSLPVGRKYYKECQAAFISYINQ